MCDSTVLFKLAITSSDVYNKMEKQNIQYSTVHTGQSGVGENHGKDIHAYDELDGIRITCVPIL